MVRYNCIVAHATLFRSDRLLHFFVALIYYAPIRSSSAAVISNIFFNYLHPNSSSNSTHSTQFLQNLLLCCF